VIAPRVGTITNPTEGRHPLVISERPKVRRDASYVRLNLAQIMLCRMSEQSSCSALFEDTNTARVWFG
jgi:hypothetical protein